LGNEKIKREELMANYNAFATPKKNYLTVNSAGNLSYSGTQIPITSYYSNKAQSNQSSATQSPTLGYSYDTTKKNNTTANPFSTQLSSYNTASNDYLKRMQELANQAQGNLGQQRTDNETRLNADYDRVKDYYSGMIPTLQGRFDQYQTDANATLEEMRQATDRSKASTRNQYLAAQRDALIAQRNNQATLDQKHAALGTIDSSFYNKDNANMIAEANRYRQMSNMEMADRLTAMDAELATAERQAQQAILQERNTLEDAVRQINFQLGNNESARQQALADVLANYNNSINSIQSNLASIEYNLAQEKWGYEQQLLSQQEGSLSEQFMNTGVPVTENDYRYMVENAGNYEKLGMGSAAQKGSSVKSELNTLLDNLLASNTNSITGLKNWDYWVTGTDAQMTKNYYDQLKAILSVENRELMKGTGQISDYESKLLERASSALGQNLSNEDFRKVLEDLKTSLGGNYSSGLTPSQISQYAQMVGIQ
jgi:hypothetical protein